MHHGTKVWEIPATWTKEWSTNDVLLFHKSHWAYAYVFLCWHSGVHVLSEWSMKSWIQGYFIDKSSKRTHQNARLVSCIYEWICSHTGMFVCKRAFLKRVKESQNVSTPAVNGVGVSSSSTSAPSPMFNQPPGLRMCMAACVSVFFLWLQLELSCRLSNSPSLMLSFTQ